LGPLIAGLHSTTNPSASRAEDSREREMIALVVLANTYVDLKLDSLRTKLNEVFSGEFLPPRDKGNFVVGGPGPGQFFIQANMPDTAGMFLLNNVPGPYSKFSSFANSIEDASIRRRATAQCCWLSVDLVHKNTSDTDAYQFIAQVLAKLAPSDAAFLVHPSKLITIPFDDVVRARLAKGDVILANH
jgi:hypothetical protein